MSIKHNEQKIKVPSVHHVAKNDTLQDIFLIILIVGVGLSSFALGRLSISIDAGTPQSRTLVTETLPNASLPSSETIDGLDDQIEEPTNIDSGSLVASVNSTKYHFPWCPGAQRINDTNKIFFKDEQAAREAGYTPAANCKGLK